MSDKLTKANVIEVFTYLDDFLDMMIDLAETPEELKEDKAEYIKLKRKISEELRIELHARLFIKFINLCQIKN